MINLTATNAFELRDHRAIQIIKHHQDIDVFRNIHGANSESWLVDRTQSIKLPFRTKLLEQNLLPQCKPNFNKALYEICISRALELSKTEKTIYLLWSGGIDSTLVLSSFLLANISSEKIIVVCNRESIKENPNYYKNFILEKFRSISSEAFMQKVKTEIIDGLIVSGEQGDLIFGQDFGYAMFLKYGKTYLTSEPTRKTITKFFKDSNMTDTAADCWYDIFIESSKKSPRPLDTVYDFSWWAGFNWRWQWSLEKVKMRSRYDQDIVTFFSSDDFQQWSYHHKQYISNIYDFKLEYKKIIFEYTKNKEDLEKIKIPSATLYYGLNSYTALTEDGNRYFSRDFSIMNFYDADNFIFHWLKTR